MTHPLRDRYELGELLGAGGMGKVYRAHDRSMNREVAIKLLTAEVDGEALQRFLIEGRLLSRVRHANVVSVYDLDADGDQPYIVTECLEGGTLSTRLDARSLSVPGALEVMAGCLDGLAACHAAGILHRDLKPANILFVDARPDSAPKLADFGIAKEVTGHSLTETGAVLGTPLYMAPEVLAGEKASFASDVHAMGAILYAMLAGRAPFRANNLPDLLRVLETEVPPSLDRVSAGVPPEVARIVARALAKPSIERPTVAEFAAVLRAAIEARQAKEPKNSQRPRAPSSRPAPRAAPLRVSRARVALALAGALGLAAGLAVVAASRRPPPPLPPVPVPSVSASPLAPPRVAAAEIARQEDERRGVMHDFLEACVRIADLEHKMGPAGLPRLAAEEGRLAALHERLRRLQDRGAALRFDADGQPFAVVALACRVDAEEWLLRLERSHLERWLEAARRSHLQSPALLSMYYDARASESVESTRRLAWIFGRFEVAFRRPAAEMLVDPPGLDALYDDLWTTAVDFCRIGNQRHLNGVGQPIRFLDQEIGPDRIGSGSSLPVQVALHIVWLAYMRVNLLPAPRYALPQLAEIDGRMLTLAEKMGAGCLKRHIDRLEAMVRELPR